MKTMACPCGAEIAEERNNIAMATRFTHGSDEELSFASTDDDMAVDGWVAIMMWLTEVHQRTSPARPN